MRKRIKGQPDASLKFRKDKLPPKPDQHTVGSSFTNDIIGRVYTIAIVGLIIATITAICFAYSLIKSYLLARRIEPIITLLYPHPPTVGQTLTFRIRFRWKGGKFIPITSQVFQELRNNISLIFLNDGVIRPVAIVQEENASRNHIFAKFSLRKSGPYQVSVKYRGWFYLSSEENDKPLNFEVLPGLPSPKNMDFGTHNPRILWLTAGHKQYFKITAKDEYGNACQIEEEDLQKFSFQIFEMGNTIPVESKFCFHEPTESLQLKTFPHCLQKNTEEIKSISEVCLKIRLMDVGIYLCCLKYDGCQVRGAVGGQKLLICVSREEEDELKNLFSEKRIPGRIFYSSKCMARKVGDEASTFEGFVGISSSTLAVTTYHIGLYLFPSITFPINGKTKIYFHGSKYEHEDEVEISFIVQDGLRQSVRLEMEPISARMLLVCFAHNQGYVLPNLGIPFSEKKASLKENLQKYFFEKWFTSQKVLHVQHGNLIRSTLKEIPKVTDDWILPFTIMYDSGGGPKPASTAEWLNRLSEEFFVPNAENGMFQYLPGSKLLHPRSSGFARQPLEFHRLAGNILGKAVVETLLRQSCTMLSNVRFSRSMLAYVLGFPVQYKYLETDEPEYFRQIKSILESDVTDKNLNFTTLPSSPSDTTSKVNLIQNGIQIPVTNENKEHYLNLLTKHRLIHPVEEELKELRNGFHDVICKDKLCDFDEHDLELLISGGCPFSVSDLKANHRLVKQTVDNLKISACLNRTPLDSDKILNWFWNATENMSEKEKSNLVFFTTGSFSLPSCGWGALNPLFTISLTGNFNEPPKGNPKLHEIILGDQINFDNFEKNLLEAITPASERIKLPTTLDQHLANYLMETYADDVEIEQEDLMGEPSSRDLAESSEGEADVPPSRIDPFLNWLRGFVNL